MLAQVENLTNLAEK